MDDNVINNWIASVLMKRFDKLYLRLLIKYMIDDNLIPRYFFSQIPLSYPQMLPMNEKVSLQKEAILEYS